MIGQRPEDMCLLLLSEEESGNLLGKMIALLVNLQHARTAEIRTKNAGENAGEDT